MRKLISSVLSILFLLQCFVMTSGAYDYPDDPDPSATSMEYAFLRDFELTPEQVWHAVSYFGIDPSQHTSKNDYAVQLTEEEARYYLFDGTMTDVTQDEWIARKDELAHRFGLRNYNYFSRYVDVSQPGYYTMGSTAFQMTLSSDLAQFRGMDYVYFTAKLFYAAGAFGDEYNSDRFIGFKYKTETVGGVSKPYYPNRAYDVNYDGDFNVKDLVFLKDYLVGNETMVNIYAADRNSDGAVNFKDIAALKKTLAGQ